MDCVSFFTDGIDNIFLVQTSGVTNPLDDLGVKIDGHTITEYRDLNVAQFVFFEKGVRFIVVGRSTLEGLRGAVKAIYLQAIK
jgi:hypothetical protein